MNFFEGYNKLDSFETNLLDFIFENGKGAKKITTYEDLILWIEKSLEKNRAEWQYHKYRELMKRNINKNLSAKFIDKLLSTETVVDLQKMKECLIATYLFENYRDSSKNIIKSEIDLFDDVYVSENYIKKMIETYPEVIENLNFMLFTNKHKLSVFETKDIYEFRLN